jgi:pyruvate/2-oxoglutarate dehydrogenase complex dihydrolipoamide acyltransferase (E2) component
MSNYRIQSFPMSRIATIDVCEMGKRKHHVTGLIELDVTESRKKIRLYNKVHQEKVSFTAWLISVIGRTVKQYEGAASFLEGKNKQVIFEDINVSVAVEKEMKGQKVPIPLVIESVQERNPVSISEQINAAVKQSLTDRDIVLQKETGRMERLYYTLPGFVRRTVWKYLLRHPKIAFRKMGNVAFTSIGMIGKVNGWFLPISVHPICFGAGSVVKKPVVVDDKIEIREILHLSVLMDHDVMDGANMARLIRDLVKNVERGMNL